MAGIPNHLFRSAYLDTDITIEVNRRVSDHGNKIDKWETYCDEYASISTVGGSEFFAAKQINSTLTHEVVIRFRSGIKPSMRVRYFDHHEGVEKCLYVDSVQHPDHDGRWLRIFCRQLNDGEWRASE